MLEVALSPMHQAAGKQPLGSLPTDQADTHRASSHSFLEQPSERCPRESAWEQKVGSQRQSTGGFNLKWGIQTGTCPPFKVPYVTSESKAALSAMTSDP